ncbi:hypothetical protein J6590_089695 [Homalodisca vitripennis]|nr:hypothetical protein J6590_089695 [Homalodisca vitripennis]
MGDFHDLLQNNANCQMRNNVEARQCLRLSRGNPLLCQIWPRTGSGITLIFQLLIDASYSFKDTVCAIVYSTPRTVYAVLKCVMFNIALIVYKPRSYHQSRTVYAVLKCVRFNIALIVYKPRSYHQSRTVYAVAVPHSHNGQVRVPVERYGTGCTRLGHDPYQCL